MTGAVLTLTDNEDPPTATLVLSSSTISESGGVATVTATLSGESSAAVTLTVSATGAGFALSTAKTLTIPSGETVSAGTVTVAAVADTTDAPDKSVTVSATVSGGGGVSDPAGKTLTITDDDDAPTVKLALASSSIPENGGTTTGERDAVAPVERGDDGDGDGGVGLLHGGFGRGHRNRGGRHVERDGHGDRSRR